MKALIDLHTHTVSSGHAYSTIKENIDMAKERGLKVLGMSDHGPAMPGGPHLFHFHNLRVIKDLVNGVRVLKGVEANILNYEGKLDLEDETLEQLDYVIASLHPPCISPGSIEENTNAVINAMKNPYVKIIGHPDDNRFPLDYERFVKAAKEEGVLIEINNSSLNPKGYRPGAWDNYKTLLKYCEKYRVQVVLGSDSHIYYDIGEFGNCYKLLKDVNFDEELVFNFKEENVNLLIRS